MEDLKSIRLNNLRALLREVGGKKVDLARRIKKSPAQISQWNSGYRTIEEETAREIERNAKKPRGWLDANQEQRSDGYILAVNEPEPVTPLTRPSATITLHAVVTQLAEALERVPASDRTDIVAQLTTLARAPDSRIARDSLIVALGGKVDAQPSKRTGS